MAMRDQLLGTTQPVLSISLEPGECVVAAAGEFSWMTDSIQMSTGVGADGSAGASLTPALQRTLCASSLPLSAYTAREVAGTIAFASKLPGSVVGIDVSPGSEYLVHSRGFLAGTPGIEITTGYQLPYSAAPDADEFIVRRIGGLGRAWVELSGDVVRRDLAAGASLRTHPWHIGMLDASVAVQMTELHGVHTDHLGNDASGFAVLSGPGAVWLQSMPLLASLQARLGACPPAASPAPEGGAGGVPAAATGRTTPSTDDRG
jgi:uncharacterized protein (AIM24 family)